MSNVPLDTLWTSSAPPLDAQTLAQRAAASHARQKRLFALEGAATVIVVGFWSVLLILNATPAVIAMAMASGVALAGWWSFLLKNQHGTWASSSKTVMEFVVLERQRLQAATRHAQVTTATVCGLCALLLVAMPLLWRAFPIYRDEPWRLGATALILCGIVAVTLVQAARRAGRNAKLRRELEDLDGVATEGSEYRAR